MIQPSIGCCSGSAKLVQNVVYWDFCRSTFVYSKVKRKTKKKQHWQSWRNLIAVMVKQIISVYSCSPPPVLRSVLSFQLNALGLLFSGVSPWNLFEAQMDKGQPGYWTRRSQSCDPLLYKLLFSALHAQLDCVQLDFLLGLGLWWVFKPLVLRGLKTRCIDALTNLSHERSILLHVTFKIYY